PEVYLALGIVDAFSRRGLKIVGPTRSAAAIESDKAFAKELMARAKIPTASFVVCSSPAEARAAIRRMGAPVVVKAAGLAAGKGVTVAATRDEAFAAVSRVMEERVFGDAGERVVIEEFLEGEEASVLAFVDGERALPMEAAQDHKTAYDGDRGPNTGGMGAYSPAPVVSPRILQEVQEKILKAAVEAMAREGRPYRGILYAGLMITADGPKVIEFNCRFGDPETQALLPRLKSDLLEPLLATVEGGLDRVRLEWDPRPCVTVVLASEGYPGDYETGYPITGVEEAEAMEDVLVFHAGTRREGGRLLTDGGRVLGVTALGRTVGEAIERAYAAADVIQFQGKHFRRDIGRRALQREKF
ncbi:MAG: phosphoribosylamine--glycine ligase, partial [Clostridia bacterium]